MRFSGPCFAISTAVLLMSAQLSLAADSSKRAQAGRQAETFVRTDLVAGDGAAHAGALTGHPYELTVSSARRVSEVRAPGAKAPSHDDLLRGCTVDAHNKPTCPTPSGWTLVAAQGFESGALSAGQSLCPNGHTVIASGFAHTGKYAAVGRYTGGDQQVCWELSGARVQSTTTYVSWWEYDEPQARTNEEMFMFRRTIYGGHGAFVTDIVADLAAPGTGGCLFNCADASGTLIMAAEGRHGNPNFWLYDGSQDLGKGSWVQWEVYLAAGAANAGSNGRMVVWRDGHRVMDVGGRNFVGTYNYSNASVQVGGVYTYLVWWLDPTHTHCALRHSSYTTNYGNWSKPDPCPEQAPPNGYGVPFKRYFDDIVVLKR